MATRKKKVNKSQAIRECLKAHPELRPAEIADKLSHLDVSPNYISNIKLKMKGSGGRAGDVEYVIAAAEFIRVCGGIDAAKAALAIAEKVITASK